MMSAILKIKPQLDQAEARKMEKSLFDRFKNVGKTVKKTLKDVVSGGLLGFAVGLAQNMLSPIEEVEERIKSILGKATDLVELSEEFGTDAGIINLLQKTALPFGLKPDQLKSMLTSFKTAIIETQDKISKNEPLDEKSSAVKNFVGNTDMAQSFFEFVQSLRTLDSKSRLSVEKSVFGNAQYGASKRFIDYAGSYDPGKINPLVGKIDKAAYKLSNLDIRMEARNLTRDNREMINSGAVINQGYLSILDAAENRKKARELGQLQDYAKLDKARQTIEELTKVMDALTGVLTTLVGYLGDFIKWVKSSSFAKGFMKVIGKDK